MISRLNLLKTIKTAGGCFLAIILAEWIGLNYSSSAGVIALLSIHDTKRETLRVMVRRLVSFGIALMIAPVCFRLAGYRPAAIGAFLLLFTPASMVLQLQEGISVSTVLMTHFLAEGSMSADNVWNEIFLLLAGAGIGGMMNLYIPGKTELIWKKQRQIEAQFKLLLAGMAGILEGKKQDAEYGDGFTALEHMIEEGEKEAYEHMENRLLTDTRYYLRYMGLRKSQLSVLYRIRDGLEWTGRLPKQAEELAGLFSSVSSSFHESNNAVGLLAEVKDVKEEMKLQPLPAGREEFEARAVLFQILLELEQFLIMKREFAEELSQEEIHAYWEPEQSQ
ncbi:aromatic acid exporter family protein [Clostridium sp. AM58-1XD]|uniref:aromatic acid exporter family protein n=1 Tax=Clostridium sp. AM58-1XD TaxID=2292307 RepID=UPI000E4A507D|nr:aromatic acid exporter family protein [Clostridium sp. AM58-1XD]RGY98743.1 aromatic acid exporter family protein [Clostridium sp. AM58-1XD]